MSAESIPSVVRPPAPAWLSPRVHAKFWRLHFYAGFFVAPLIIWLCITGILYILTPQIESALYTNLLNVAPQDTQATFDAQVAAAQAAYPDRMPTQFHPSKGPGKTAYVVMTTHMEAHMTGMRHTGPTDNIDVYINPYTAQIVGALRQEDRYSRVVMTLHGNLYMGEFGRILTELGTVWSIVLLLTGLYLWQPRRWSQVWGIWAPRIRKWKGRVWWRDFHSVGGMYLTILMTAFLVTGLMISFSSGTIFALTRVALRQLPPSAPATLKSQQIDRQAQIPLQNLIAIAEANNLSQSYMITLPVDPTGLFKISADNGMAKPEQRHDVSVDQYNGQVVYSTDWKQYPILTKLTVWGLSFHFGDLFGVVNQVLGTLACIGLIFFTVSGVVMWWKRKPVNAWGLPKAVPGGWAPFPKGLKALIVIECILMPALGVSLLIALGIDTLVLRFLSHKEAAGESTLTSEQP